MLQRITYFDKNNQICCIYITTSINKNEQIQVWPEKLCSCISEHFQPYSTMPQEASNCSCFVTSDVK